MYTAAMEPRREPSDPQRLGRIMTVAAWVVALGLLTLFFSHWQEGQVNPNRELTVRETDGTVEVVLQRNRYGHYLASGEIDGEAVTFLLDTGATTLSIPADTAERLNLAGGAPYRVSTANGTITVYATRIDTLRLGPLTLHDVPAHINPHMEGEEVLLGMSALRQLEFTQRGDRLTLRPYSP